MSVKYRADIEGLRALAILLVVGAHAKIPGFSGGFIGVDIFFVLSGFLISGLLVQERLTTGRLDFAGFYARRFRRLLPALLLMLLVSAWFGWQLLPPSGQPEQAMAGMTAAAWVSNMHFAFAHAGYFDPGTETNLYLHTWSLGVEEQFYLVWPALIALVAAVAGSKERIARCLSWAMFALLFASLLLELWTTRYSAIHAFYLMPMRAWQFALGALVFLWLRQRDESMPNGKSASLIAVIGGIGLIAGALWLLDGRTPYPGAWALLPSLGTALLIFAGSADAANPVTRILSLSPMQWLGHVSYSWYLWHWPVLILGAMLSPTYDLKCRLLLVAASLMLALVSYLCVEKPLRRASWLVVKPGWTIFVSLALAAMAASLCLAWGNAASRRHQLVEKQAAAAGHRATLPAIYAMGCDDWYASAELKVCSFGSPDAKHTAVAMGDSIGLQWFPALARIFAGPDWRLLVLTKSSCPMVDRPIYYARIGREYTECASWRQRAEDWMARMQPDFLILGSTHTAAYTKDEWIGGTHDLLARLAPHAGRLVVLRSTPHLELDGAQCLEVRSALYAALVDAEKRCVARPDMHESDQVNDWITQAAKPFGNVRLVDMDDEVCPLGLCHAAINGRLVYRDQQHLNADFVETLTAPLAQRIGVPYSPAVNATVGANR